MGGGDRLRCVSSRSLFKKIKLLFTLISTAVLSTGTKIIKEPRITAGNLIQFASNICIRLKNFICPNVGTKIKRSREFNEFEDTAMSESDDKPETLFLFVSHFVPFASLCFVKRLRKSPAFLHLGLENIVFALTKLRCYKFLEWGK